MLSTVKPAEKVGVPLAKTRSTRSGGMIESGAVSTPVNSANWPAEVARLPAPGGHHQPRGIDVAGRRAIQINVEGARGDRRIAAHATRARTE